MTLTPQQSHLLSSGAAVPLTIDGTPCVLLRQDVFERQSALEYDSSPWTEDEMIALAERTFDELDRAEPLS